MKPYILTFLVCIPFLSISQEKPTDTNLVINTIENYFYGYIERDGAKLNAAFDTENGTMKIPSKVNNTIQEYKNAYFKDIIPKWVNREKLTPEALKKCQLTILSIDIESGQIASAKMKMVVSDKTYIDILSLQKLKDQWKITNKIYISVE